MKNNVLKEKVNIVLYLVGIMKKEKMVIPKITVKLYIFTRELVILVMEKVVIV